ncbi:hypothetical protein [Actinopolymorpha singaporensis]|uniref:Nitroreductase family protein n=1 Tax=Actinopolymorpha singaporensis TaxID=117157 RepID=A0A1H1NZU4_9ACTN|nr:hypothetical protein [Actinopolymorpha singaporensis]SDS04477.1 hypothetical protein SAMN04489717_1435 [Actinopolymorpha singaporensis]
MIARELDTTERELLVRAAILAPSAPEARSWRFRFSADTVDVCLDPVGVHHGELQPGGVHHGEDSGGRPTMVGVGAAVFNLRVAAAALARGTTTKLLPDPGRPGLLAQVRVWPGPGAEVCLAGLLLHLYRPRSGRRSYADRRIPPAIRQELEHAAATEGAILSWPDDRHGEELRTWDGCHGGVLDGVLHGDLAGVLDGDLDGGLYCPSYGYQWTHAVLTTDAAAPACPRDWLVAGQALQRVLLVAARHGLAGSAFDGLDALDGQLGGLDGLGEFDGSVGWPGRLGPSRPRWADRPAQVGLRLGWGPSIARTPPRPLTDFVADDLCS